MALRADRVMRKWKTWKDQDRATRTVTPSRDRGTRKRLRGSLFVCGIADRGATVTALRDRVLDMGSGMSMGPGIVQSRGASWPGHPAIVPNERHGRVTHSRPEAESRPASGRNSTYRLVCTITERKTSNMDGILVMSARCGCREHRGYNKHSRNHVISSPAKNLRQTAKRSICWKYTRTTRSRREERGEAGSRSFNLEQAFDPRPLGC